MNRVLFTEGNGKFEEKEFNLPDITDNEIRVKSIMTGVCRSDIDMMMGNFGPLPLSMQGHEGLGEVVSVGKNISDVKIGDFVATRGEPAYADIYNVRIKEYVKVPEAHPKYIIEPVACGINIVLQPLQEITTRSGKDKRLLILGTGFLAWVAYCSLKITGLQFEIDVVGSSNREIWGSETKLLNKPSGEYDVIIDLSGSNVVFETPIVKNEALVILGSQKTVTTDFSNLLWKACTMIFPSPRTDKFYKCMQDAVLLIETDKLKIDKFWSRGYNRDTEWANAFTDGLNRPAGYGRGYIYWNNNDN